jgi:hypothetical protein
MNWFEFIAFDLYNAIISFAYTMNELFFQDINIPFVGNFTLFELSFGALLGLIITRAIIRAVSV